MRILAPAVVCALCLSSANATAQDTRYEPTWESVDTRPLPQWFSDAKFGIFIHWGVYSVPSWGPKDRYAEWYWHDMNNKEGETWKFHQETYGEDFKYQDFAPMFKAELFNPAEWADVFKRSGAKYIVLTSKHHEGFALWPSAQSWNWNSVDIGPHRDLCGDLITAVREQGLRMGFYYSIYEWYNPLYLSGDIEKYATEHMLPQLKDLVQRYKPDLVWPDGEWDATSDKWHSAEFLAWLFNESDAPKDVVVNDRWGKDTRNVHGGFATPEYGHIPEGRLIELGRWEECQGMGKSFGYNRNENADNYRTSTQLLHLLIDCVSRGGNLLL
ncbi:MAG: alpha-L-fucosidase, partial [Candidatus Hydrogenedentes bacterium]|nr:alpha-L-fucosidase [Candidatus Hydrogenedentota bacterium]